MRAIVVGGGAMGGIYAGMLHDGGNDVSIVEANPAIVSAINEVGMIIIGPDGHERVYPLRATDRTNTGVTADLILFQVKGFATAAAAEAVRPMVGPATIILTLQNGLGNEDVLRTAFPGSPLVIGVSLHSAAMMGPGRSHHTGVRATTLGPAGSAWSAAATAASNALRGSNYEVKLMNEAAIRAEIFAKWVLNCGSLPTAALTGLATTMMSTNDVVLNIVDELTREACLAARAEESNSMPTSASPLTGTSSGRPVARRLCYRTLRPAGAPRSIRSTVRRCGSPINMAWRYRSIERCSLW